MSCLVPDYILHNYKNNRLSGNLVAYTMFIDISGFTKMTESLMKFGKEGAEILSSAINTVFAPSIKSVYDNGGFVSSFAGDAFTAIFQCCKPDYPLHSAFYINDLFKKHKFSRTKFGCFEMNVKIGLSYGTLEFHIVNTELQKTYYFRGLAIDNCAISEQKADKMHIVADSLFMDKVSIDIDRERVENDWYRLLQKPLILLAKKKHIKESISSDIEKHFIPSNVMEQKDEGEFREIVSCFISFDDNREFNDSIRHIIMECHKYGGYFNRVDFGDKGAAILVLFGAPAGLEKLYERAVDFIISLKSIKNFLFRAGITTGIAFTGFLGSGLRREYTALGNIISLSSRLMVKADWGQILTESGMKNRIITDYRLSFLSSEYFKGFSQKIEVWRLESKIEKKKKLIYNGKFIGRIDETKRLKELLSPISENRFGGLVYIDGPAGIGKSRFISHFKENVVNCEYSFLHMYCDEILRKSFNPFGSFFKNFFSQFESDDKEVNKISFLKKYRELVDRTENTDIKNELIRTESIIGAMVGLEWNGSLYSMLDAKGRYENTVAAVKNFIKAYCRSENRPLIIIVEDCHWIDNDSIELIKAIIRNVEDYSYVIVAVCRFNDDGSCFNMFSIKEVDIPIKRLDLSPFSRSNLADLVLDKLQTGKIPIETENFILQKSGGNPFFAEQITLYLMENHKLDKWFNIKCKNLELPSGITQIILARIDRLSGILKDTIKTASVLGREFVLSVLKKILLYQKILENKKDFERQIENGKKQQIWEAFSEISYIFKHSLIRDAVYDMQLKRNLRNLHNIAGNIIEGLYSNDLNNHYEELAEHYKSAENVKKAIFYCQKAGDLAKERYFNSKAISYYDNALTLFKDLDKDEMGKEAELYRIKQIEVIRSKASVLDLFGKWEDEAELVKEGIKLAKALPEGSFIKKGKKNAIIGEFKCCLGWILTNQGNYDKSLKLLTDLKDNSGIAGDRKVYSTITINIGIAYKMIGDYEMAMHCYNEAKNICEELNDKKGYSAAIGNMGLIHCSMGHYHEAMQCYDEQKRICSNFGDKRGYISAVGNMGIVYYHRGEYNEAMQCYSEQRAISRELGDKNGYSMAVGNMGILYYNQGNYDEALQCCNEQKIICKELGDMRGYSIAVGNMGTIYHDKGNYGKAISCYIERRTICRELGDRNGYVIAVGSLAVTYQAMGYYDKALSFFLESENDIKHLDRYNAPFLIYHEAKLFLRLSNKKKAKELFKEALKLASGIGRKDIIFKSKVMIHAVAKSTYELENMLNDESLEDEQTAKLNYELWKLTNNIKFRLKAREIYKKLFEKAPKQEYKKRIVQLNLKNHED